MPSLRVIAHTAPDYAAQVAELIGLLRGGGLVASVEKASLDVAGIVATSWRRCAWAATLPPRS